MARTNYVRHSVRLKQPLSDRLRAVADKGRVTTSAIVREAIEAFLVRSGEDELELRFARRLDRFSAQLARIERNGQIGLESLGLFVQYMLTVNPPINEHDEAGRAIGRDRFAAFVERVGQQLADGHVALVPEQKR